MELDKIDEISKAAAIKASTSLSKLIHHPVGVDVSPAFMVERNKADILKDGEETVVSITTKVSGDLNGLGMFCFPKSIALLFCDMLTQQPEGTTKNINALEISALTEVANIIIGNFLGLFAYPLKLDSVMHNAPNFEMDKLENILKSIDAMMDGEIKERYMVEILISLQQINFKGYLIFMLGMKEMQKALEQ